MDEADREALKQKSAEALNSAQDGETVSWSNPDSGASAVITPKETRKEVRTVALLRKQEIAPLPTLELIGEIWVAKTDVNVRAAPTTDSDVVSGLTAGETFTAVGQVEGKDWIVVGQGNRTTGYVSSSFVHKSPTQTAETVSTGEGNAPTLRNAVDLDALDEDGAIDLDAEGLVAEEVAATSECRTMNVAISTQDGQAEQQDMKACKAADGAWEIL